MYGNKRKNYHYSGYSLLCIIRQTRTLVLQERNVLTMNKRQDLINRIEKLTDKQFELLINLFSQQEPESVPVSQPEHRSSFQSSE